MADTTTATALAKEVWESTLERTFNSDIIGMARIERTSRGVKQDRSSRYVLVPVHSGRNHGIAPVAERGPYPLPGNQAFKNARVNLRKQTGVGDITEETQELMDGDPRSFIDVHQKELSALMDDLRFDYSRQFYGDGTGALATITAVGAAPTYTVDNVLYFIGQEGMRVDVVLTTGPTVRNTGIVTVDSVDIANSTVTLSASVSGASAAGNDIICRHGAYNLEVYGLGAAIKETGSFQNLNPATTGEAFWASRVQTMGTNYTDKRVVKELDYISRTAAKLPSVFLMGAGLHRSIWDFMDSRQRFVNTITFTQGYEGIPFSYRGKQIPIVMDPWFPEDIDPTTGDMIGLCESDVTLYRTRPWHFVTQQGSMYIPAQDRSGAWEYRVRQFSNFGYHMRNTHMRLNSFNITA